jgi:hypothetical protein
MQAVPDAPSVARGTSRAPSMVKIHASSPTEEAAFLFMKDYGVHQYHNVEKIVLALQQAAMPPVIGPWQYCHTLWKSLFTVSKFEKRYHTCEYLDCVCT